MVMEPIPKNIELLPIKSIMEQAICLLKLRRFYESQISDKFDLGLSKKIDVINSLLDAE